MAPRPRDRAPESKGQATTSNAPAKPVRCIPCQLNLPSIEAHEKHLLQSSNHFACFYCYADHHTVEALDRHMKQMHPAEQELQCPGCRKSFNRLGGLMSHMEYNECQFLIPGFVQELRANNPRSSGKFEAIRAATAQNGRIDTGLSTVSIAMKRQSAAENDDLISFPDAASHANDASWYRPAVPVNNAVEFPALTLADVLKNSANPAKASSRNAQPVKPANTATLLGNSASYARIHVNDSQTEFATPPSPAIPAWNTVARAPASHVLFPNAAPAIAPLAAQIQNLSMSSNSPPHPVYQEHDPDDPNFDVNRYYVDMLKYYQCPHRGCKKNLNTVSAFFQHLRSPAHMKLDQVKCPQCLRPFLNTTALTQHIESQTVRCDARNLESAGILVEDLTQVATVIGVHEDETIKYGSVQSTFVDAATAAANAIRNNSRRTIDAQADFKDKHWDEKKTFGNW